MPDQKIDEVFSSKWYVVIIAIKLCVSPSYGSLNANAATLIPEKTIYGKEKRDRPTYPWVPIDQGFAGMNTWDP